MSPDEMTDTKRVAAKLIAMGKALRRIMNESSAERDKGDCLGAGRRLERIRIEAKAALDALHAKD